MLKPISYIFHKGKFNSLLHQEGPTTSVYTLMETCHSRWNRISKRRTHPQPCYIHKEEDIDFQAVERIIDRLISTIFKVYDPLSPDYTLIGDMTGILRLHADVDLPLSINAILGRRIAGAFHLMGMEAPIKPKTKARLSALVGVDLVRLEQAAAMAFSHR